MYPANTHDNATTEAGSLQYRLMHVLRNDRVFDLQPQLTRTCHGRPTKLQEKELVTVTTPPDHIELQQP